jgi:hypothetical protein
MSSYAANNLSKSTTFSVTVTVNDPTGCVTSVRVTNDTVSPGFTINGARVDSAAPYTFSVTTGSTDWDYPDMLFEAMQGASVRHSFGIAAQLIPTPRVSQVVLTGNPSNPTWNVSGETKLITKNQSNLPLTVTLADALSGRCNTISVRASTLVTGFPCFESLQSTSTGAHSSPQTDVTSPYVFYVDITNSPNRSNWILLEVLDGSTVVNTFTIFGTSAN